MENAQEEVIDSTIEEVDEPATEKLSLFRRAGNIISGVFNKDPYVPRRVRTDIRPEPPEKLPEKSLDERLQTSIAEFDEDSLNLGERTLNGFMQLTGYTAPFVMVIFVGSALGEFFTASLGAASFGLAYILEAVIAGLTVAMGKGFADCTIGKANYPRVVIVSAFWLVLNASSAFGLYLMITHNNQIAQGSVEQYGIILRVVAVALIDLGCSAILMFKGHSLQKHLDAVRKKQVAIRESREDGLREKRMLMNIETEERFSNLISDAMSKMMNIAVEKVEKAMREGELQSPPASTGNEKKYKSI